MTQQSPCWARKPELKDMCTPVFITALFIIARSWKKPRCPSADEWIRTLWYIYTMEYYTMEYYSAIKKNTFESVLMRWMKLEPIIWRIQGWGSMVGCHLWGRTESDTTEVT